MPRADNRPGARFLDFLERGSTPAAHKEERMEALHPHWAGPDVHKDSVVASVRHVVEAR
jgi:hypothetical protein